MPQASGAPSGAPRFLTQKPLALKPVLWVQLALMLSALAAVASIWIFCAVELAHDRQSAQDRVAQSLQLLSLAMEDDTERAFDSAGAALSVATADARAASAAQRAQASWRLAMSQRARQSARLAPGLSRMELWGPKGRIWDSDPDASRAAPPEKDDPWSLAPAAALPGEPFLLPPGGDFPVRLGMLSAAKDDPNATLAIASVGAEHFVRFWRKLDFGPGGAAALIGSDGRVRLRLSGGQAQQNRFELSADSPILTGLLKGQTAGSFLDVSPFDAELRLYAWRKLPARPLLVVAALAEPQAFASFRNEQRVALSGAGAASFLLIFGAFWLCALFGRWDRAAESAKRASAFFSAAPEPMALLSLRLQKGKDPQWRFAGVNAAFEELARCAKGELNGAQIGRGLGEANVARVEAAASESLLFRQVVKLNIEAPGPGSPQHLRLLFAPTLAGNQEVAVLAKNYTAELNAQRSREQIAQRLRSMAHFDQLTGLPNRALFSEKARDALLRASAEGERLALMFIDLDNFKLVNDTRGHAAGDALLVEAARRAQTALEPGDLLARLGGDEFVAIIERPPGRAELSRRADRLIRALSEPIAVAGNVFHIGASVGVAIFPEHGLSAEDLMKSADAAMYKAKEAGKNQHVFFASSMHEALSRRLRMETLLRQAFANGEFRLVWQPQIGLASRELEGFEALARWRNEELGDVPPSEFVPLAESSGLIEPFGQWVFENACAQIALWRAEGLSPPRVAFNLSALQLRQPDLEAKLQATLGRHGLLPNAFEAEITESSLIADPDRAAELLRGLRANGMHVAVDDFGVGYSSLSYLTRFEIDALKIDRIFVEQIGSNRQAEGVIEAIASLAAAFGARVVAEGVERAEQADWLAGTGCELAQGYFFSRPLEADAAAELMRQSKPRRG
jgi:diguanylate cyclase (GGDEF)-like protein